MKVGRPPKYNNTEELQEQISAFFLSDEKPVTISGLAYFLGFESRQSFYDYEKDSEFSYTIKRARLFIEKEYEEMLQVGNTTGAIFALKNMGWIDSQKIETTQTINLVDKLFPPDDEICQEK